MWTDTAITIATSKYNTADMWTAITIATSKYKTADINLTLISLLFL
jgi:hypothetical protein